MAAAVAGGVPAEAEFASAINLNADDDDKPVVGFLSSGLSFLRSGDGSAIDVWNLVFRQTGLRLKFT